MLLLGFVATWQVQINSLAYIWKGVFDYNYHILFNLFAANLSLPDNMRWWINLIMIYIKKHITDHIWHVNWGQDYNICSSQWVLLTSYICPCHINLCNNMVSLVNISHPSIRDQLLPNVLLLAPCNTTTNYNIFFWLRKKNVNNIYFHTIYFQNKSIKDLFHSWVQMLVRIEIFS